MSYNYVIDTNVLVHDYHSFSKILKGNNVYIPYVVLEELDNLKTKNDQVGVNARRVIKLIEQELINNNSNVIVIPTDHNGLIADDKIIKVCYDLKTNEKVPILVSKDVCLRTKARAMGIDTQDYKDDKINVDTLYSGVTEKLVSEDVINEIYARKIIDCDEQYHPNQAVILVNEHNEKLKAITIYRNGKLKLIDNKLSPFGLKCANLEQHIAVNLLLDPEVKLVSLMGKAGSGKTIVALASALEAVLEKQMYKKVTVARPIMPFQRDIGFLPGSVDEKLIHWFGPIIDNLEFLFSIDQQPNNKKAARLSPFDELQEQGVIEMLPMTYVRGRSIPNQLIVIDEVQNITGEEIKTLLTRAGVNSKIILTGDVDQIDNPFLTADSNGLVYCIDKFKNENIAAHITFNKCERSELAEISSRIL